MAEQQRSSPWTDPRTIAGWRGWQPQWAAYSAALTEAIAQAVQVQPDMRVLDIAGGSGEPAFTLARAVVPNGHVTATDLSPGMVETMRELAQQQGLENVTCEVADAVALPFPDESFDVATSRLGVMSFPDPEQGLREMRRVLKPGGRVVLVVWGPAAEQGFVASALAVLAQHVPMPPPEPGAPDAFRFAEPGSVAAVMRQAGLRAVSEEVRRVTMPWAGSAEQFVEFGRAIMPELGDLIAGLPPERRDAVVQEMAGAVRRFDDGTQLTMPAVINVASGTR